MDCIPLIQLYFLETGFKRNSTQEEEKVRAEAPRAPRLFWDITPSPRPRFRWGFVFDRINRIFGEIYQLWQGALDPVGVEKGE
jgi:hypothetical protein